ncbi:MAG: PAS domain S-box protein [Acidobacteriaceae bacterium]
MNATLDKREVTRSEALQLETLDQYEVLRAAPDPALDDLVELAAKACNTPVAGLAFATPDHISINARYGIGETELPLGSLPALPPLRTQGVYEVPDTAQLPAFARAGIALAGRTFRFFAAVPLVTPSAVRIGSLFVLDSPARRLTPLQLQTLTVLGRQAMTTIELNHTLRQMERVARARQRVESALTVERNFVSTVLDTVDALVAVFDTAGRIVRFNRACESASGYDFPALVGRTLWDMLIPHADVPAAVQNFARLRAGGSPAAFENQWMHRDGSLRRIAWSASPLFDDQGRINFIIATGIDVTVQRSAEETLRESEARYRQLVEGSLGLVCTHDLQGILLSINTHGAQTIGRAREDLVGHRLSEFMPQDRRAEFDQYLGNIALNGEVQGLLHLCHVNGGVRVLAFRNKLIQTPARGPYVLGFAIDISEQVHAEDKLRALMRQSNSVLESVGDGIYGIDLQGICTVVNPAASQMLGFKPEELLGRNMHSLIHHTRADGAPYREEECPIQNSIHDLDTVRISNEVFWRKDGTSFPVEYVARPQIEIEQEARTSIEPTIQSGSLFEIEHKIDPEFSPATQQVKPAGKAVGVVVAFTDTTERRALDRMKDEFISTVSHELRTPLTSLRAALGLITGGSLDARPQKLRQMLEIAAGNTDRLVRLVNDIIELERIGSGKAELHSTMCSADDLFRRAAILMQSDASNAQLRITFNSQGVNVWADPDRILQVLANLISNAIKFSPPGTEIHMRARRSEIDEAEIQVRDQGRGIPEDKLDSIFERFLQVDASDSRAMGGTGLGLSICRSIITQHRGRIWATSTPGKGSTFHFTLPTRPAGNLL